MDPVEHVEVVSVRVPIFVCASFRVRTTAVTGFVTVSVADRVVVEHAVVVAQSPAARMADIDAILNEAPLGNKARVLAAIDAAIVVVGAEADVHVLAGGLDCWELVLTLDPSEVMP